jgi:hypothetical protein
MITPTTPYGGGVAVVGALIFLIVLVGLLCYCCHDFFEQDKKYKTEQRMKQGMTMLR